MKRCLFCVIAIMLVAVPRLDAQRVRPLPSQLPADLVAEIDSIAADALSRGLPGMEVGVRYGTRTIFFHGYGEANMETETPVRHDTVFQVGSITKQFVAALIMKLVERGQIHLDDSIADYVPELDTRGHTVTLHHLLTHVSGAPNYTNYVTDLTGSMTSSEVVALVNAQEWDFPPGDAWSYSNTGYYLLGLVIEKVTGTSFVDFLNNEIIYPLGLTQTSYCGTIPGQEVPTGYQRYLGSPVEPSPSWDPDLGYAAGALCSTAGDLVRWTRALSRGEVVTTESYELMTTRVRLNDGSFYDYGYGLQILDWVGHREIIFHGGAVPGFLSFLVRFPKYDLTICVLTNLYALLDFSSQKAMEIATAIIAEYELSEIEPVDFQILATGPLPPGTELQQSRPSRPQE